MMKHHHKNKINGMILASAGEDVRLWQMPDLGLNSVRNGTNANVVHCACSPSGQLVAYSHEEEGINIASILDDSLPLIEIPTPCEQSSVGFNGNSRYVISGGIDCVINIWDIKSRTAKRTYKDHDNPVTYCMFNYNDNLIASASDHGEIILTNVQSGLSSDPLTGADDPQAVRCIGYSYFSRSLMASISDSGSLCLWDTKEKKLLRKFSDHKGPGTGLSFSPLNDMLLCSTALDKRIIFYDVSGKKTVKTINTEGPITCCDFMSDGCTVAAGSASGHVFLFDLRQGSTPIKVISGHKTSVRSVSFQRIPKESKSTRKNSDTKAPTIEQNGSDEPDMFATPNTATILTIVKKNFQINNKEVADINRENSSTPLIDRSSVVPTSDRPPIVPTSDRPPVIPTSDRPPVIPTSDRPPVMTSDRPPINDRPPLPIPVTAKVNPVRRVDSLGNVGMGMRENSTLALNKLISLNQTPEQAISAIPPKAARLMGDDIFSPIQTEGDRSSTLPRKLKASKQKSVGASKKYKTDGAGDNDRSERPTYGRSKSGLSRLSMLAKSMEDINSTKKSDKKDKEMDNDANDGKKGGGLFKSPFKKKKHYNKHSDESETSSIDSLSLEDKFGNFRGKKDRLSDRSNDSGNRPMIDNARKISNGLSGHSPSSRQIDTNQLLAEIQHSLATQSNDISKSPSIHSGDYMHIPQPNVGGDIFQYGGLNNGGIAAEQRPAQIQVDFIQKLIDEAMEENRAVIHDDIVNLQVEMLRQMEIQKEQIRQMLQQNSVNGELLTEIERLRSENERLKTKY